MGLAWIPTGPVLANIPGCGPGVGLRESRLGEAIAVSNFIYLYIHLGRHHVYRIETCDGKDLEPFLRKERRVGP